jgi:hypothetical protein
MNVKNLNAKNMPRTGDVMIHKADTSLGRCKNFTVQVRHSTDVMPLDAFRCLP